MNFIFDLPLQSTFILATIILTLTPGPDMALYMGQTITRSQREGFAVLAGANLGLMVHTLATAIGLSSLLAASPAAFNVLKIAGFLYLLWLAATMLRNGSSFSLKQEKQSNESISKAFRRGLVSNLLNPKIIIFFVTFLPQFVAVDDPNAGQHLFILGMIYIAITIPIEIALVLSANHMTTLIRRSPKLLRMMDWLFASVIGLFAIKLLFSERH